MNYFPFDLVIIDLEINNPRTPMEEIFQLGWVILKRDLSIEVGENIFFRTKRPLTPYIEELTGCKQEQVEREGLPAIQVVEHFNECLGKMSSNRFIAAWGDDVAYLRRKIAGTGVGLNARSSELNLKIVYQMLGTSLGYKPGKGLKRCLTKHGLGFDTTYGQQHSAMSDAFNTARLIQHIFTSHRKRVYDLVGKALSFSPDGKGQL